jgi:hypothetical protein
MQPAINKTNIYMFLITSLLSWFLKLIFLFQIEFFFICVDFFLKEKFFKTIKHYTKSSFILLYTLYIIYYTLFVCFFQVFFILFIFSLKKTPFKVFSYIKNKGMFFSMFSTVNLYNPVLLTTTNDNTLFFFQFLSKVLFVLCFFFFLNILV